MWILYKKKEGKIIRIINLCRNLAKKHQTEYVGCAGEWLIQRKKLSSFGTIGAWLIKCHAVFSYSSFFCRSLLRRGSMERYRAEPLSRVSAGERDESVHLHSFFSQQTPPLCSKTPLEPSAEWRVSCAFRSEYNTAHLLLHSKLP